MGRRGGREGEGEERERERRVGDLGSVSIISMYIISLGEGGGGICYTWLADDNMGVDPPPLPLPLPPSKATQSVTTYSFQARISQTARINITSVRNYYHYPF